MYRLSKAMTGKKDRPVKVVQFGEGNFLRAFVDYMIDIANERGRFDGDIVLVKPTEFGSLENFHRQDCQYTVSLRGIVDGEAKVQSRQVTSVADAVNPYSEYEKYMGLAELETLRFVVSNTTEAGIVYDAEDRFELTPPGSFPGKLTKFLYHRYETFGGALKKGLVMLPVELIDDNGIALKKCVMQLIKLWGLGDDFRAWVEEACVFTSTLVDRIVTGYPKDNEAQEWKALGYEDRLLVTGEPFALWVIESPRDISGELPLPEAGLPVIFTADHKPYKQRKVRILNGAHTSFVLASYLCGNNIVKESMEDGDIRDFMEKTIFDEVIPTLALPEAELKAFAEAVIGRFNNPYVKHALLSISLNSVSKWRVRCMPSLLEYREKFGRLPQRLTFSLAALMVFYQGTEIRDKALIGHRDGQEYRIMDDMEVLEFFRDNCGKGSREFTAAFLGSEAFFGQDLTKVAGLTDAVADYLEDIRANGMRTALCRAKLFMEGKEMSIVNMKEVETEQELREVLELCYSILGTDNSELYSYDAWYHRFIEGSQPLVYAMKDNKIVSAVLGRAENEESLVIGFAACHENYRRQGITKELLGYFEDLARKKGFKYITLGSEEDAFYEKCGYKVIFQIHDQNIFQKIL